jgi:type I restriction enzyme R subunit
MSLNESIVEDAALEWFGELGYAVGHGPHLAPGEYARGTLTPALSQWERESYGEVVLVGRLREAIRRLNPAIPEEASPVRCAQTGEQLLSVTYKFKPKRG